MLTFYTILWQVPENNPYGPGDGVRYSELEIENGIARQNILLGRYHWYLLQLN
jgi:hypothetical protein